MKTRIPPFYATGKFQAAVFHDQAGCPDGRRVKQSGEWLEGTSRGVRCPACAELAGEAISRPTRDLIHERLAVRTAPMPPRC